MNSKLANALDDGQKLTLMYVCRTFATYSEEIAFKYLWNLTYKPEYALDRMGLFDEEYLSYYKKVRNYIAEESGHIKFIGTANDYPQELLMALQQDKFAVKRILLAMDNAILNYPMNDLERIKKLLTSDEENCHFGGLKSLKLNNDEANFFIGAVKAIANYFVLKFEEVKKNCGITESNQSDKIELISENEKIIEKPELINNVPETITEVKEKDENAIPIVEMLLKNKESIEAFLALGYENDCDSMWSTKWILECPEVFRKVILITKLWDEIKSEILDYDFIFENAASIEKNAMILERADALKALGINAEWIWKKKDTVENLFQGFNGAAI